MAESDDSDDCLEKGLEGAQCSLQNLSLEEEDLHLGCYPMASTPKKNNSTSEKHQLTPNSKLENQPLRKRFQQNNSHPLDGENTTVLTVGTLKPTSGFYKLRREAFVSCLQEHFEEQENSEIQQSVILEVLQLDESKKVQATNAVKDAFPLVQVMRTGKERRTVYRNVARKCISVSSNDDSQLSIETNPEIRNLKQIISSKSNELDEVTKRIENQLAGNEIKKDVIRLLIDMQQKLQLKVRELSSDLERLYEIEIHRLLLHPSKCKSLCSGEKDTLNDELETFTSFLNIGMETESLENINFYYTFTLLPDNVRDKCPLLFDVLNTLFLHKADGRDVSEKRVKSAVHSLALLVSLRSQKMKNDLKIMFTCLCISFGAGLRFVTMLNRLGLTVSWDKVMSFFDSREAKQQKEILEITPLEKPVILMFDNVNMYRGRHKHLRLFKSAGPVMWNFTCQAVFVPNTEGLEDILQDKSSCLKPQKSVLEMDADAIFIEEDQEKSSLFEKAVDVFLLDLLDAALNKIPESEIKLKDMSEPQMNAYLAKANFLTSTKYTIDTPDQSELATLEHVSDKSDVRVLPLSLEDNSTIVGTMSILDQLASDFSLPNDKKGSEYIPFDSISKTFDVKLARSHYELLLSQRNHQTHMRVLENQLYSNEKEIADAGEDDMDEDDGNAGQRDLPDPTVSTTLESERPHFESEDKPFWDTYNLFCSKLSDISTSNSEENYIQFVNSANKQALNVQDHLGRTLLHAAVEQGQENMVKCLVDMGLNVNSKEGCGITPLSLAVLHKNVAMSKFLLESGSKHSGPMFTSVPSPMYMADTLNLEEIKKLFDEDQELSEDEDELICQIAGLSMEEKDICSSTSSSQNTENINRSRQGFVTPVVGDVGSCKTNNAAMTRSSAYEWVGICPGDLHNKGYYCEAVFKVHGSSGLHYILLEVMKRKKLGVHAFKKKKFQDGNLLHIREAIRDVCKAYGLAAVIEFSESTYFPSQSELLGNDNSTSLILTRFKEWISKSSASDIAFQHRATAFLLYGPLQMLYDVSTEYGDGYAREIVYQLLIPIYTQLGFSNYSTEVFRHVVNFLAKWPLATRKLLQQNCSVNLSGKGGHGIELDAFVESEVVQPFKNYTTGHTTVNMCKKLMANIDLLKFVRGAYMGKGGFDVHHTSRHSVQTPFPDQLKGAWFCLRSGFFKNSGRREVQCYPIDQKGCAVGKVPQNLLNVVEKGKSKIKGRFTARLYESFPDLRYDILS